MDQEEIVKLLLQYNANVNAKSDSGETALSEAFIMNNDQIVEILLEHNANANVKSSYSWTGLVLSHLANS